MNDQHLIDIGQKALDLLEGSGLPSDEIQATEAVEEQEEQSQADDTQKTESSPDEAAPVETHEQTEVQTPAASKDIPSEPAKADDSIEVLNEELASLKFKIGEEVVSLETLMKERMPREHFLKKNTELDQTKKQLEQQLAQLQELDSRATKDTVGYIQDIVTQGFRQGTLTKEQAEAFGTTFDFMQQNSLYNTDAANAQRVEQAQQSVKAEQAALISEREMMSASQTFLEKHGKLPSQLDEETRQLMYNYVQNKRMVSDGQIDFIEAFDKVQQFKTTPTIEPATVPTTAAPNAPASRNKVIDQLKKGSNPTSARPRGSTEPVESSKDLTSELYATIRAANGRI